MNEPADPIAAEKARLKPMSFDDLPGFANDDHAESWTAFRTSCFAIARGQSELRPGRAPSPEHLKICVEALELPEVLTDSEARSFYEARLTPYLIEPRNGNSGQPAETAFFTAYYRPEVDAALERSSRFQEPILGRPHDLVTLGAEGDPALPAGLTSARRMRDGRLAPFPTRREIDAGALQEVCRPIAYVRDAVEAFMIQVQGSARLRLEDGGVFDLTYAGRNGHPYTSIGKILIEEGKIAPVEMSLEVLKEWVRRNGQQPGQAGRELLHRNSSFVFFSRGAADENSSGPIGAAGLPLRPYRSIAVDRHIWAYGLPFWIEGRLPWRSQHVPSLSRMMIAQDTGSAILGPARADLYFGSGAIAAELAGGIRHNGRMYVLLPKDGRS